MSVITSKVDVFTFQSVILSGESLLLRLELGYLRTLRPLAFSSVG